MSTTNPETPQEAPVAQIKTLKKYGPLLLIAAVIVCGVGYRLYKNREAPEEPLTTKVGVTSDGNAVTIPTGVFRVKQIDLAHLKVPTSAGFRARFYIIDTIDGREVTLEMIDESSCVLMVPEGDVNYALVRYGLAQADGSPYQKAEDKAKKESLGIWNTQSEKVE